MSLRELIEKEYDKRTGGKVDVKIDSLATDIKKRELELAELKNRVQTFKSLKDKHSFIVERDYDGIGITVQKKGSKVRILFDEEADITSFFQDPEEMDSDIEKLSEFEEKIKKETFTLSKEDFILDCKLVRGERGIFLYALDIPYLGADLTETPLKNRKDVLKKLSYNDFVRESPFVEAKSPSDIKDAIELFKNFDDAGGIIVKRCAGHYGLNQLDDWVGYNWEAVEDETGIGDKQD